MSPRRGRRTRRRPETRAGDDAVHRGDDRLAHLADLRDDRVVAAAQLVAELEVLTGHDLQEAIAQILPGREPATRAGDDDRADRGIGCGLVDRDRERARQRLVERVEDLGPVEGYHRERAIAFEAQGGPGHYLPLKLGLRLFTKASTPSFLSSVAKRR